MPSISLTEFVDFVLASGSPKMTKVRQIKHQPDYKPWRDHWKILRNGIVDFHVVGKGDRKFFDRLLADMTDGAKRETYGPLVTNYKRYLGRKTIVSAPPDRHITWKHGDLEVRVNPELRLTVNEQETIIKLYFKKPKPAKKSVGIILLLMKHALPASPGPVTYCLLDVRHNKEYKDANPSNNLLPLLRGEAENFLTIWKYV
jgi:hypothetical protein